MKREIYRIEVERPDGVSVTDLREYMKTAINQWGKGGDPDSPFWYIEVKKITRTLVEAKHGGD